MTIQKTLKDVLEPKLFSLTEPELRSLVQDALILKYMRERFSIEEDDTYACALLEIREDYAVDIEEFCQENYTIEDGLRRAVDEQLYAFEEI